MRLQQISTDSVKRAEAYRRRKNTAVLAILFTDIARSTALREELGEVAYEEVRHYHDSVLAKLIEQSDAGAVVEWMG